MKEYGDKIPADKKGAIETGVAKLKEAHKSQDIPTIDTAMAELNAAWTAASQDIYNAQGGAQPDGQPGADSNGGGQQNAGAKEDNVTDVPYEEVK